MAPLYIGMTAPGAFAAGGAAPVAPTVPDAPTVTLTAGNGQISVAWTDGGNGGSAILSHNVYLNGSPIANPAGASPYVISGLTNGISYAVRVSAINGVGEGPLSTVQNATPAAAVVATYLPTITGGYAAVRSNRLLVQAYLGGPVESACALTDTASTPATPLDIYPIGTGADPQAPDYSAAYAAFGQVFNIWKRYSQLGDGNHAVQGTAANRPIVRYSIDVVNGKQVVTFGWNNTTGATVNTTGLIAPGGTHDRANMAIYALGNFPGGGGGMVVAGAGNASPLQAVLGMDQNNSGSVNAGGIRIQTSGAAIKVNTSLIPDVGGLCVFGARLTSASQCKYNVNDRNVTVASGLGAGTLTGSFDGIDTVNAGAPWFGSIAAVIPATAPSDADHALIVAALMTNGAIPTSTRLYIATCNSLAFYENPAIFNRTLWTETALTTADVWQFGMIGAAGRSQTQQFYSWFAEVSSKYDATRTKMGYEITTISNDVNLGPFVGNQSSTVNPTVITAVNPIPWWIQVGVPVVSGGGIPVGTTIAGVNNTTHEVTLSQAATTPLTGAFIKTIPNNIALTASAGVTLANNPLITGLDPAVTANVIDGSPVYSPNLPATAVIQSHTTTTITLVSGTGVTANAAATITVVDQAKVTAWGNDIVDNLIIPKCVTPLKALGPNVFVNVATTWAVAPTFFTVTGALLTLQEQFARNAVMAASNARLISQKTVGGYGVADDAAAVGTNIQTGNVAYTKEGAHIINGRTATGTTATNGVLANLIAPIRKTLLDAA